MSAKGLKKNLTGDLAGAFGDIGTFLPLWLAMVAVCGLDPVVSLLAIGVAEIGAGILFRAPMAVQPMKAVAAVSIAAALSPGTIAAAGTLMGALMLLAATTGLIQKLSSVVPPTVVRGLQWAIALKLFIAAIQMIRNDDLTQALLKDFFPIAAGLLAVATLTGVYFRRTVWVTAILLGLSITLGLYFSQGRDGFAPAAAIGRVVFFPTLVELKDGFLLCVVPQFPMTLLNSVLAVSALGITLFPDKRERFEPARFGVSVGFINLIACPFGAMPMCHGSGGLAGQYAFGARTGLSMIFLGCLKILLGISCAAGFVGFLQNVPRSILGIWITAACIELIRSTLKSVNRQNLAAALSLPIFTLATDSLVVAAALSWGVEYIARRAFGKFGTER